MDSRRIGGGTSAATVTDEKLVALLVECGCEGPLWLEVRDGLARFGVRTVQKLLGQPGHLATLTGALGRPVRFTDVEVEDLRRDADIPERLATDAVIKGLQLFREHAVLGGQWRGDGGACLETYFVNGCLLTLTNIVRAWRTTRRGDEPSVPCDPEVFELTQNGGVTQDPLDMLVAQEDVTRTLQWLGPVLSRAALLRLGSGQSWAAIAAELHISPKRLERELQRFRARHDPRGPETTR